MRGDYGFLICIEPYLTNERILIAPHDVLHYVPFAALHDGEGYFIERHTLVQLPSASILPFILAKARREGSVGLRTDTAPLNKASGDIYQIVIRSQ